MSNAKTRGKKNPADKTLAAVEAPAPRAAPKVRSPRAQPKAAAKTASPKAAAKVVAEVSVVADAPAVEAVPDPVAPGVVSLMEVFDGPLEGVRFPDVDHEILSTGCDAVRAADAEVRRLFDELEAAQVHLAEVRANLHRTAERGLAYARVFADDSEEVIEALDAVDLGTGKKGKGRAKAKPKTESQAKKPQPKVEDAAATPSDAPDAEKLSA